MKKPPKPKPLVALDASWKPGMGSRPWASVVCDNRAVAETAAEELLATGRRHFAVVPVLKPQNWTKPRERAFLARIRAAGCEARRYTPRTDWDWGAERAELARWLSRLPRPFGVFAPNDWRAKNSALRPAEGPAPPAGESPASGTNPSPGVTFRRTACREGVGGDHPPAKTHGHLPPRTKEPHHA